MTRRHYTEQQERVMSEALKNLFQDRLPRALHEIRPALYSMPTQEPVREYQINYFLQGLLDARRLAQWRRPDKIVYLPEEHS